MMQAGKGPKDIFYMLLLILLVFICVSCNPQKSKMEDGPRIIHNSNSKWGDSRKVSLELIRTFGGIDIEDENFIFVSPQDVAMDSASNIYLLDYLENRIQKCSSTGEYLITIGRQGQGPGDFNAPYSIDIDKDDRLYVLDRANKRIQILTDEGEYYSQINLDRIRLNHIRVLDFDLIALGGQLQMRWSMQEQSELPRLIDVLDKDGNVVKSFGEMTDFGIRMNTWYANHFYFDIDAEKNFYLSYTRQNSIKKFNRVGNLIWEADRQLVYSTDILEDGYIETLEGGVMFQAPKMNEVSRGISLDSKQRVWILTFNRQFEPGELTQSVWVEGQRKVIKLGIIKKMDIYRLEIYEPSGILLGIIQLNHLADGMRIQKDYLFIWEVENAKYYQYKIIEQ